MSQEEAEQAEKARQQAEQELLAMYEGVEGHSKKKSKKKKKVFKKHNTVILESGAGAEGELFGGSEVGGSDGGSRDAANALPTQTLQTVCNQPPSQHGVAQLEASLAQATSTDQNLIAQATQQRKAIRGKLKKLRNKENR